MAEPASIATVDGLRRDVMARTADPAERATWWDRACEAYEGYEQYQSRTRREIPIVLLEPVRSAS